MIPPELQVFPDRQITLSSKDIERLTPLLANWLLLAAKLRKAPTSDVERLLILELMGTRRRHIVDRLIGRWVNLTGISIRANVEKFL